MLHNIEEFRQYAQRGVEVKADNDMLNSVVFATESLRTQGNTAKSVLLSKEGLKAFTILNPRKDNIQFPVDEHIASLLDITTVQLKSKGHVGYLFGIPVYTDHYLPEGKQFITGLGRVLGDFEQYV